MHKVRARELLRRAYHSGVGRSRRNGSHKTDTTDGGTRKMPDFSGDFAIWRSKEPVFSPFFAFFRIREEEAAQPGGDEGSRMEDVNIQLATRNFQAQERKLTAGRFGPLKKARKNALERFGSVYSNAKFGVRSAQWRNGEVTSALPRRRYGGGRECG